jgi:hypothetical protein
MSISSNTIAPVATTTVVIDTDATQDATDAITRKPRWNFLSRRKKAKNLFFCRDEKQKIFFASNRVFCVRR